MLKITYESLITYDHLTAALKKTKTEFNKKEEEIKKNFSETSLKKLQNSLKLQTYQPNPMETVTVLKCNKRGLDLFAKASQCDNIVKAAILLKLEPILADSFSPYLFNSKSGNDHRDVLYEIKHKWQNVTWFINIDASKHFTVLSHKILLEKLYKYCDQATVELIIKLMKSGYLSLSTNKITSSHSIKAPQKSLSQILHDFYLKTFDEFIESHLLKKWGMEKKFHFVENHRNLNVFDLVDKLTLKTYFELKNPLGKIKRDRWIFENRFLTDLNNNKLCRLSYIRYGNNFLIGVCGTRSEAAIIQERVFNFLQHELKLALSIKKSELYHSSSRNIFFLGYNIRHAPNKKTIIKKSSIEHQITECQNSEINHVILKAPIAKILIQAVQKKYAIKQNNGLFRATSQKAVAHLPEKEIINHYSSIIRTIIQYYSYVNTRSDLWRIVSLYRKSCALTLANKLGLRTAKQVFKKFGSTIEVKVVFNKKTTKLYYPKSLRTKINFKKENSI